MQEENDIEIKFIPLSEVFAKKLANGGSDSMRDFLAKSKAEYATWTNSKLAARLALAFEDGSRISAYLMSDELTRRGIPPYFRNLSLPLPEYDDCDVNRRFDLLAYDLQWIVAQYPAHQTLAPRYMDVFKPGNILNGAEHIAKRGNRAIWEIVRDMKLSIDQQWDCHAIRDRTIAAKRRGIKSRRLRYIDYFTNVLKTGKSSGQSEEENEVTRKRRFNIWICSCVAGRDSPTRIAKRYEQLTGEPISKSIVSRQLKMIPGRLSPT